MILAPLQKKCKINLGKKNVSPLTRHLKQDTCNQHGQAQPQTLPLLTTHLCTVDWFAKTEIAVGGNKPILAKVQEYSKLKIKVSKPFNFQLLVM